MKRQLKSLLAPLPLLFGLISPVMADPYRVLSIGDGDTIRVRSGSEAITVRLACIDAPEMAQALYGRHSRTKLAELVPVGSPVSLKRTGKDKYGRVVAEVFSGRENVNLHMVTSGNAFVYRSYLKGCDRSDYLSAEDSARVKRLGVWFPSEQGILKPWSFRSGKSAGKRFTCSSLGTRSRAEELYRQGHTYLDANNDGIPCNSLRY